MHILKQIICSFVCFCEASPLSCIFLCLAKAAQNQPEENSIPTNTRRSANACPPRATFEAPRAFPKPRPCQRPPTNAAIPAPESFVRTIQSSGGVSLMRLTTGKGAAHAWWSAQLSGGLWRSFTAWNKERISLVTRWLYLLSLNAHSFLFTAPNVQQLVGSPSAARKLNLQEAKNSSGFWWWLSLCSC